MPVVSGKSSLIGEQHRRDARRSRRRWKRQERLLLLLLKYTPSENHIIPRPSSNSGTPSSRWHDAHSLQISCC